MSVLPIIDLLILVGWTSITAGFAIKAVNLTIAARLTVFGISPSDFLLAGATFLLLALALAARTWVKSAESRLVRPERPELRPAADAYAMSASRDEVLRGTAAAEAASADPREAVAGR